MIRCPSCQAELADDAAFCTSCGHRTPTQADDPEEERKGTLAIGELVDGKYRVERILGEGGMGVVYLARSIHTDVEVVIKAVLPEIAHRADIRQRTLDEGKALARIDHPNVVQLKAVVVDDEQLLLIMQYIEGDDLEQRILRHAKEGRPIPFDEVLRIFEQVLSGVAAAHDEGVIHRDLKPANILIRKKDGVAKVTDFGIAKPVAEAQQGKGKTQGIIGSVHFMAPEQVKGDKDLDRRADVYALGIMLFQMVTGRVPFDADNTYDLMRMQIEEPLPSVTPGRADLPAALDGILQRACAKDREHRFGSCEAFGQAIEQLRQQWRRAGSPQAVPGATIPQGPAEQQVYATAPTMQQPPMDAAARAATRDGAEPTYPDQGYGYGPAQPGHGTITSQPATYSPPSSSGRGWVLPAIGTALLASVMTALVLFGIIGGDDEGGPKSDDGPATPPTTTATASPTATATAAEPEDPLKRYAGRWISESGRELDAVVVGDKLEFQVVDPSQFGSQGYRVGEARFVLHPVTGEEGHFTVEDRIRPVPPAGFTYDDANARTTCLAIWRQAGGQPLKAQAYGDRLDVDFAKIEPTARNFALSGRKVMSCKGLERLDGTRIPSVLRRP